MTSAAATRADRYHDDNRYAAAWYLEHGGPWFLLDWARRWTKRHG